MTIAELCMVAMLVVTIGAIAPAKFDGRREYDNARPRNPAFFNTGFRQRAQGAHQNSYECLPFFFAAVLLAEFRAAPQATINALAVAFLLARVLYVLAYWTDRPSLRSAIWIVALACNLALFFLPGWG
jgi:uncharacterized MAPEG superfamily protein